MFLMSFIGMFVLVSSLAIGFELLGRHLRIPGLTMEGAMGSGAMKWDGGSAAESAASESGEAQKVRQLEERIRVLEAIVTDRDNDYYD